MKSLEDKIKERLEDYESRLPAGDLAEFKALLDRAEPGKHKVTPLAWIVPVAVAASVALVFLFSHHPELEEMASVDNNLALVHDAPVKEVLTPNTSSKLPHRYAQAMASVHEEDHAFGPEIEVEEYQEEFVFPDNKEKHLVAEAHLDADSVSALQSDGKTTTVNKPGSSKFKKVTASVLGGTGGVVLAGLLSSVSSGSYDGNMSQSSPVEGPGYTETVPIADEKTGDDSHSFPLHTALSLRVPMSDRWSLTTGVDYSIYSSKIGYTVSGDKRQKVHYIGVPVRADYTLARNRWMDVYLGAGALADFCVAAYEDGHKVDKDGIGFSLIGGGGIQFNFSRNLGIFVDPTFSWDIHSGGRVLETYKSAHPFSFTVSSGIRITLKGKD